MGHGSHPDKTSREHVLRSRQGFRVLGFRVLAKLQKGFWLDLSPVAKKSSLSNQYFESVGIVRKLHEGHGSFQAMKDFLPV